MPRIADGSSAQTELEKANKTVTHLIEITYYNPSTGSDEQTRITTAVDDISTDGSFGEPVSTWTAIGIPGKESALNLSVIKETSDLRAQSVRLELDAVDQTFTSFLGTRHFRGQPLRIWRAWYDKSTGQATNILQLWDGLQNDPYEISEERPDPTEDRPGTATISTTSVSRLARFERAKPVLTNQDSHNNMLDRLGLTTGDTGMQNVLKIMDKKVFWGQPKPGEGSGSNRRDPDGGHDGGSSPVAPQRPVGNA